MANSIKRKMTTHTVDCPCGTRFTYSTAVTPRRILCGECVMQTQRAATADAKRSAHLRSMSLPKTWKRDERRAYVSAEGHLNKALVAIEDLQPAHRNELIRRLMVAISPTVPARRLPPRNVESD